MPAADFAVDAGLAEPAAYADHADPLEAVGIDEAPVAGLDDKEEKYEHDPQRKSLFNRGMGGIF